MFLIALYEVYDEQKRIHHDNEMAIDVVRTAFLAKHNKSTVTTFSYWLARTSALNARRDYPAYTLVVRDGRVRTRMHAGRESNTENLSSFQKLPETFSPLSP